MAGEATSISYNVIILKSRPLHIQKKFALFTAHSPNILGEKKKAFLISLKKICSGENAFL